VRTSFSVLGSLAIAAVAFGVGALTAVSWGWGQAIVIVDIVNRSGRSVSMATLQFDTCGHRGSIQAGVLASNASTQIQYIVCGKGSQTVIADFGDGSNVASISHVESGYRLTERISREDISEHSRLAAP
jgi:hypothetical protein